MSFLDGIVRPVAEFRPSVWGYHFLNSPSPLLNGQQPEIQQRSQYLKEKVGRLLLEKADHPLEKLKLIDNLQRLGVSYHFESEIEEILEDIHTKHKNTSCFDAKDVHTISLCFRLLRQQGYNASPDIFKELRDKNGEFEMSVTEDVVGMLNLYEASHFGTHGEDVLHQALHFTTNHLQSRLSEMSPNLRQKVGHALKYPIRKGIPRLEARHYIGMYSQETSPNDPLLEFAILDFNALQALYKQELNHATQWWKKLNFVSKVPYARDRVVEDYFCPLSVYFQPQYTSARMIMAKLIALISAVDDTYDAYATLEELQLFTQAIRRWDASPLDPLPECMKVVFQELLELFKEMELLTAQEGKSCFVQYVKHAFVKLAEAYLVEAKWCNEGYTPTYEEYIENGMITSSYSFLEAASFLGLGNCATKQVFDWISNDPKIVRASAIIGRVTNDMSSHKFERKRVHVASAVECLMNQHGIAEEEAYKLLRKELEKAWKDINEEWLKEEKVVPKVVLECVVNFSSVLEFVYGNLADRYTEAELLKDYVAALVVDPIPYFLLRSQTVVKSV